MYERLNINQNAKEWTKENNKIKKKISEVKQKL